MNAGDNLAANHNFVTSTIGSSAFDIGHVFIRIPPQSSTFVAGIAIPNGVCRGDRKGRGASSFPDPGDFEFVSTAAHEIAHQFSATHTWNSNSNGCDPTQYRPAHAFEPGSGTTILSYQGACAPDNIPGAGGFYYHGDSHEAIVTYSRTQQGANCPVISNLNNQPPTVAVDAGGFFIPISTPFELTGSASDGDGDVLTYCWEQFDLGPPGNPNNPVLNAPIFRSFPPVASPTRIFPQLPNILNNTHTTGELLPTYDRDLTFRLTVRDQNGGVVADEIAFQATEDAGPFEIEFPNAPMTFTAGLPMQVQWDVANTDLAPVNCSSVDIYLSENGGLTFPHLLAADVPNTGSTTVLLPDLATNFARIKIKGANNIFFDISDDEFQIELPSAAGFALFPESDTVIMCGIQDLTLPIFSYSLLGFTDEFGISAAGLPTNVTGSFVADTLSPGDTAFFQLSTLDTLQPGLYPLPILAFSQAGPSEALVIQLQIADPVIPGEVAPLAPGSGTGVAPSPNFIWNAQAEASSYTLEVATSPAFGTTTVARISGITDTTYTISNSLAGETSHYWRVRADNPCGSGPFSVTEGFQTGACDYILSTDIPLAIPTFGTPATVSSILPSLVAGDVTSVKVVDLVGTHTDVSQLSMSLTSPSGTMARLFSGICSSTDQDFELNFSDDGLENIPCPPTEGEFYRSADSLAIFNGELGFGVWTLSVTDSMDFDNGQVLSWGLEICKSGPGSPILIKNDPLTTTQWFQETIPNTLLEVQDAGSSPDEIVYTVVSLPQHGGILLNGTNVPLGGTFTQQDIDQSKLAYLNNGNPSPVDSFRFDVVNSGGGWIGVYAFQINVSSGVDAVDQPLRDVQLSVYPNPSNGQVAVAIEGEMGDFTLKLMDIQGRDVFRQQAKSLGQNWQQTLDFSHLSSGLYLLQVSNDLGILSAKLVLDK